MRPFNIIEAKSGEPVQTTQGLPVKILTFDRNDPFLPIVALIDNQEIHTYTIDGKLYCGPEQSVLDLWMVKEKTEHGGYINVFRSSDDPKKYVTSQTIYGTRESAYLAAESAGEDTFKNFLETIKITWRD